MFICCSTSNSSDYAPDRFVDVVSFSTALVRQCVLLPQRGAFLVCLLAVIEQAFAAFLTVYNIHPGTFTTTR